MTKIWQLIKAVFIVYIVNPIKRLYNFYICHAYIPDNERNRQLFDYFIRVAKDGDVQPQTPVEVFFETQIHDDYFNTCDNPSEEEWTEMRQDIATDLASEMLTFRWVDDDSWWRNSDD